MIRSMTGFGRGEAEGAAWHVQIDLRTVNHRFLDIRFRLPVYAPELELRLRERIAARITRGKVDCTVDVREKGDAGPSALRVNRRAIRDYLDTLRSIREEMRIAGDITIDHVAMLAGGKAIEIQELRVAEEDVPLYEEALAHALDALQKMRETEGGAIREDIRARLASLRTSVDRIEGATGDLLPYFRDKLRERVRTLLNDTPVDEDRLLQEAAFFAERADITEELTRLRSHLQRIEEALQAKEPVGKRLDFLLQEVHREVNTIGSKAKVPAITDVVIEAKAVSEAIREQIQNIE